jgi:predicted amidohydrolase
MSLQIKLAPLCVKQGEFGTNINNIKQYVKENGAGQDLIVFPQYAVTGYPSYNTLNKLKETSLDIVNEIAQAAKETNVALMFSNPAMLENNNFQDVVYYINKAGEIESEHIRTKKFWREDNCVVERGTTVIELNGTKIGILCGDEIYYPGLSKKLREDGASCIICLFSNTNHRLAANLRVNEVLDSLITAHGVSNECDVILCSATGLIENDDQQSILSGASLIGCNRAVLLSTGLVKADSESGTLNINHDSKTIDFFRMVNRRSM